MGYVILGIAVAILAFGCLILYICFLSLIEWIRIRKYTPPTQEELKTCTKLAVNSIFNIK